MTTSILAKLKNLKPATGQSAQTPMTEEQVKQCKAALRRDLRGPAVQVNKFDLAKPYRVTVNWEDKWTNHGVFSSADVAAAVGSLVSASVFGDKALAGYYDEAKVEASKEFTDWLADSRNIDVLSRVNSGVSLNDMKHPTIEEAPVADGDVF
jgi:hypothetical protein